MHSKGYWLKGVYFPHPDEVAASKARFKQLEGLTFKAQVVDGGGMR